MKSWTTFIGVIAAIGTTACWLPQAWKTVTTRSARDFHWGYLALLIGGVMCWNVYGFLRRDWVVLGANAATLALVLIVAWVKIRER